MGTESGSKIYSIPMQGIDLGSNSTDVTCTTGKPSLLRNVNTLGSLACGGIVIVPQPRKTFGNSLGLDVQTAPDMGGCNTSCGDADMTGRHAVDYAIGNTSETAQKCPQEHEQQRLPNMQNIYTEREQCISSYNVNVNEKSPHHHNQRSVRSRSWPPDWR